MPARSWKPPGPTTRRFSATDEREYIKETHVARWKVEELLKQNIPIIGVNSDNSAGEYPAHGTHGLYSCWAFSAWMWNG